MLTDSQGTVSNRYSYDAFGNEVGIIYGNDKNPFRYRGEYYDLSTGTYYLRARSYNPVTGRFITEDTVRAQYMDYPNGQTLVNSSSLNLYIYCINNPMMYIDPSGHVIEFYEKLTEKQKEQYDLAIKYLKTSKTGRELIKTLEDSDVIFKIRFSSINQFWYYNYDNDNARYIYWNMSGASVLGDDKSVRSPALSLAHEMGHAAQYIAGDYKDYQNGEELPDDVRFTIEADNLSVYETPIARQLGEFVRSKYTDTNGYFYVSSSTNRGIINTTYLNSNDKNLKNWQNAIRTWKNNNTWSSNGSRWIGYFRNMI